MTEKMELAFVVQKMPIFMLMIIVSHLPEVSGLIIGNSNSITCDGTGANITFNIDLQSGTILNGSEIWYHEAARIATKTGGVFSPLGNYASRLHTYSTYDLALDNITDADKGSYLFVFSYYSPTPQGLKTATATLTVKVSPSENCMPIYRQSGDFAICELDQAVNCGSPRLEPIWTNTSGNNFTVVSPGTYNCCANGSILMDCYRGSSTFCKTFYVSVQTTSQPHANVSIVQCQLVLGLALGLGLGIQFVINCIAFVIFKCKGCTFAYILGLVLGLGVIFEVTLIIIVSLVFKGNECKLEHGLGLGLGSGMPCVITGIIAVIFVCCIYKCISNTVELGKGILTGLLVASVIGIIVVYLKYDKLKPEPRSIKPDNKPQEPAGKKPEEVRLEPTDKKSKTNNSGSSSAVSREHVSVRMENKGFKSDEEERPTAVHTRTQNKFDPNTNSKQTNDRQQPVPPANTGFEDTPTFRRLPQPPQNIKDRNQRGISATIDDTSDLASETPRPNKLPPLTPKQTVQKEDASEEPKKKKKKKKKKDQMNVETPEEENGETDLMVN